MAEGYSEACCKLPKVEAEYTPKGDYVKLAGLKTYRTGPTSADTAIILAYDVFGLSPQIIQGADILAHPSSPDHHYQAFIPDFMHGAVAQGVWFTNPSPATEEAMGKFLGPGGPAEISPAVKLIPEVVEAIKKENPNIKKFGIIGYCWGGKVVSLTTGEGTPFGAAVEVHPSLVDPKDASSITVPLCMLASQNEDKAVIREFEANLKVPKHVEFYDEVPHGWMAARGDFVNEPGKSEYQRGYAKALEWFHTHL